MRPRLRDRLTYANVMSTLALFIALGGTSAYAASQISSGDIKNRSIKGGDLRKDTITGTEVNESKLKEVPSAASAGRADTARLADNASSAAVAEQAKNATSAGTAINATNATNADVAKNSTQLAGQGVSSFEKSTRTTFGKAPVDPSSQAAERVLLDWPEFGVQVTTATNQAGACGGNLGLAIKNGKPAGTGAMTAFQQGNGAATVAPQARTVMCTNTGGSGMDTEITDSSGRTLFVDCVVADNEVRCIGTRSEP